MDLQRDGECSLLLGVIVARVAEATVDTVLQLTRLWSDGVGCFGLGADCGAT